MIAASTSLDRLAGLLTDEARLYGELLELGEQERSAVVGGDPSWLNALVATKERLVERIARVEADRQDWIAGWAEANGAAPSITLAELVGCIPPAEAARIGAIREALLVRVRDVAEINHRNNQLLGGALRIVNRSIEAFSRVRGEGGYGTNGEPARAARTLVLDRRA